MTRRKHFGNAGCCAFLLLVVWVAKAGALSSAAAEKTDLPAGPGSLTGVWVKVGDPSGSVQVDSELYDPNIVLKTAGGAPVPLQPWAARLVDSRLKDAAAGHPYASTQARCLPPGVPDMMFEYGPVQILETPGQVTILRQELTFFRIIRMNQHHLRHSAPSFAGDSVGRWQGDTLLVDTIGLTDKTGVRFIMPHSQDLHVIERYRRIDKDQIEVRATIDDPKTFTKTWTEVNRLKRLTTPLTEYFCENNRNGVDANGNETVRARSAPHAGGR